ncbi:MAG: regulatory protein RecX [Chromatiaceae bacterium]|nr:regulatory protein RecX [Chromatiaceae bacterium]
MSDSDFNALEQAALRLLGQREHSRAELYRKLKRRVQRSEELKRLLDHLAEQGLQSDQRYTLEYIDSRRRRGFGPIRIRQELIERGISAELLNQCIDPDEYAWDPILLTAVRARFGEDPAQGLRDWARRARFLQYRGFAVDHIRRLLPH